MNFPNLHRSRTITGVPTRLRASRAPGLPPSDTGPLGDNIYEWLQTCPKTERIPLRTRISEEQVDTLDSLDKFKDRGKPDIRTFEKDFVNFRYNIPMAPGPGPGGPGGYDPRYVALPGEDSVFDELYGTDAYVKLDILPVENQYHYPNLDTASKGYCLFYYSRRLTLFCLQTKERMQYWLFVLSIYNLWSAGQNQN